MEARITHNQFFDALFNGDIEVAQHFSPFKDEANFEDPNDSCILFVNIDGQKKDIEVRDGKVALLFELSPQCLDKLREQGLNKKLERLKSYAKETQEKINAVKKQLKEIKSRIEL